MWVSLIRTVFEMGALALMMVVLAAVMALLTGFATGGPNADHESVGQLAQMFNAMTVENLTLLVAIAAALYLLWRATVEGNIR